jgi:nucleotide-binding universal stress UspA family protein
MGSSVRLLQVVAPDTGLGTRVLPVSLAAVEEARRRAGAYLDPVAERFRGRGVPVDTEVLDDSPPALAILEVVEREQAHLVALATHGYRGVRRAVLGSVADKVLRGADVPLLLLGPGVDG